MRSLILGLLHLYAREIPDSTWETNLAEFMRVWIVLDSTAVFLANCVLMSDDASSGSAHSPIDGVADDLKPCAYRLGVARGLGAACGYR